MGMPNGQQVCWAMDLDFGSKLGLSNTPADQLHCFQNKCQEHK
jgi:hypothetical protein